MRLPTAVLFLGLCAVFVRCWEIPPPDVNSEDYDTELTTEKQSANTEEFEDEVDNGENEPTTPKPHYTEIKLPELSTEPPSPSAEEFLENIHLNPFQLDLLDSRNISIDDIRSFAEKGLVGDDIISLSNLQLSAEDIGVLASAKVPVHDAIVLINEGLTPDEIVSLSDFGVTTQDIHELLNSGFTASQLIRLNKARITPLQIKTLLSLGTSPKEILHDSYAIRSA